MSRAICMWSGPRNLSTAMMRSFGSREDCTVWDEPFFAPFLAVTGKAHPGRDETLATHETDPEAVARACARSITSDFHFQKHMPHHMLDSFPIEWAADATHFFLLRHPRRVIASYAKGRAEFDHYDLGFQAQRTLFDTLTALTGTPPPVIHSEDILANPKHALTQLCAAIHIPFDPAMLSWKAGPHPEDGAWAPYWYASVESSTGFGSPPKTLPDIDPRHAKLYQMCEADYTALGAHAIDL